MDRNTIFVYDITITPYDNLFEHQLLFAHNTFLIVKMRKQDIASTVCA